MTSTTTNTTETSDDVAQLAIQRRLYGDWALLVWRPRGGFTQRRHVDLRAVEAGLRRLIS